MIEHNGNILDTDASYIAHGVNTVGVMGAGIAKTYREAFPNNYKHYKETCESGALKPGDFLAVSDRLPSGRRCVVVNLASQDQPGPNASYQWLFSSLYTFAEAASKPQRLNLYGGIIAIPEIGCGIGGLKWRDVKCILKCIESMFKYKIEFEVWHYEG